MAERKLWFARLVCGAGLRQLQKMLQQSRVHKCFCHPLVHVLAKTVCIKPELRTICLDSLIQLVIGLRHLRETHL